ncbi:hypothetical protein BC941DRAFT_511831 [Chlamydoabsidia padenii]|nr:hypothetical protein BC941DRAFT_511831 [Chlamydoabsidia padenii]
MAVVALGCGSWLETHPTTDCGFQTAMSVFEVSIYQNISDRYALTPSSVTFGLWKHCFYYAQNCTCTPVTLGYEIDAEQSIFAATNNLTMPSVDTSQSSYIRLIPLILALVLSMMAFAYSFWASRSCPLALFWINGGMAFVGAVLVAIAFGATYQSYRSSILKACQAANLQSVRCASMSPKLEVTLLAVALGLLVLASALFGCMKTSDTVQDVYRMDEKKQTRKRSPRKQSRLMKSSSHLSDISTSSKEHDAVTGWQDEQLNTLPLRSSPVNPRSIEYAYKQQQNTNNYNRRFLSNTRGTTSSPTASSTTLLSSIPSTNKDKRRQKQSNSHQEKVNRHHGINTNDFTPLTIPYHHHPQQQQRRTSDSQPNRLAGHGFSFNEKSAIEDDAPLEDQQQHNGLSHYSDASLRTSTPISHHLDPYRSMGRKGINQTYQERSYHQPSTRYPPNHKSSKDGLLPSNRSPAP